MIGRVDRLDMRPAVDHWKAQRRRSVEASLPWRQREAAWRSGTSSRQDHGLDKALDHKLIEAARPALERGQPVQIELHGHATSNRTVGAMLSGEVAERYRPCRPARGHDLRAASPAPPARASAPSWRAA